MRSMPRVFVLPFAVALALVLGACSDGPSVSSQTHEPMPSASAPSGSNPVPDEPSPTEPGDTAEPEPTETPSDGSEPPTDGEEPTSDDEQESPSTERPGGGTDPAQPPTTDPSTPPAEESPTTSPADPAQPPTEEPSTETPSTGGPEEPTDDPSEDPGNPGGGDGVRAAAGAARSVYPAADVVSVVHIDDGSGSGPPADTGYVVVLVAGDERVELTLDAAYGVVTETSATADAATLALVEDDHLTLEEAIGRITGQGVLDGDVVRSVELVSWEGEISWDFYVFGTSTMVASVDAGTGSVSPEDAD